MHSEEEIRRRVKKLQQFYMNLLIFVGVNVLFSLIWLTSSLGTPFWPKYIIIVWGVFLMLKAYRMKLFSEYIPFLTPEWEKNKVHELMVKENEKPVQKKVVVQAESVAQKSAVVSKKAPAFKKAPVAEKVASSTTSAAPKEKASSSKAKKRAAPKKKKKS